MTKLELAIEVLTRAQEQMISEIATCGTNGGIGRAQNYAPSFVQVTKALEIVKALDAAQGGVPDTSTLERMAALRAAKAAKQQTKSVQEGT